MRKMPKLEVVEVSTKDLLEYEHNSKLHPDEQIDQIAASIREFGNCDPIAVWHNADGRMEIVEGHGRLLALKRLGIGRAPVIFLDHLTDEQRKAYGIIHNQLTMNTGFDLVQLQHELDEISSIDMSQYDLDIDIGDWFSDRERNDSSRQDGNEEYNDFLDKFETKKTTDDCYTPDVVYDSVAKWVADEYGLDRSNFVRPFYPNGDYQKERYPDGCVVVDNQPFSILAEILRFYTARDIKFFLFSPTLTLFSPRVEKCCFIPVGVGITYENGANVNTSFTTNLETARVHVRPTLYDAVKKANDINLREMHRELPKYDYPSHVITAANLSRYAVNGVELVVENYECVRISALDAMKKVNKGIYGSGFLLSDGAAERNAEANIQQEENKIKKESQERREGMTWELSERERTVIASLGRKS